MSAAAWFEIVGYAASALIVVSLTMKSILRLRLIGLAGSLTFLVYGVLIEAFPIVLVNSIVVVIHAYHLRHLLGAKDELFTPLFVRKESEYLKYFCRFYAQDIRRFIPDFVYAPADDQIRVFILRDMVPAGLFIADGAGDGEMEVKLDYVIPDYRDLEVGRYLFSPKSGVFAGTTCRRVWTRADTEAHAGYLRKMGFAPEEPGSAIYAREVAGPAPTQPKA